MPQQSGAVFSCTSRAHAKKEKSGALFFWHLVLLCTPHAAELVQFLKLGELLRRFPTLSGTRPTTPLLFAHLYLRHRLPSRPVAGGTSTGIKGEGDGKDSPREW